MQANPWDQPERIGAESPMERRVDIAACATLLVRDFSRRSVCAAAALLLTLISQNETTKITKAYQGSAEPNGQPANLFADGL